MGPFLMLTPALAEDKNTFDINTALMQATFRVSGPNLTGQKTTGTTFIVTRPYAGQDISKQWLGSYVLVTAAHVFDQIISDYADLELRTKKSDDLWQITPIKLHIRASGKPLYVKHPTSDVVVMYLSQGVDKEDASTVQQIASVPWNLLAEDKTIEDLKLHPGSTILCLGYPWGASSTNDGFAILRGGTIASYPLTPLRKRQVFDFDFEVFPGNSGGPVYYFEPGYDASLPPLFTMIKTPSMAILGLVTEQRNAEFWVSPDVGLPVKQALPLKIGRVIPGAIIKDTIEQLPEIAIPAIKLK